MEENKNISNSKIDLLVWILIVLLVAAGIVANQYFKEIAWSLRFVVGLALSGLVCWLSIFTSQGKRLWAFIKTAKIELYKVVWPSRDETIKTTAIVAALVFAMSIILWIVDTILLKVVNWFTN